MLELKLLSALTLRAEIRGDPPWGAWEVNLRVAEGVVTEKPGRTCVHIFPVNRPVYVITAYTTTVVKKFTGLESSPGNGVPGKLSHLP